MWPVPGSPLPLGFWNFLHWHPLVFFQKLAMSDGRVCFGCGVSFQFDCLQKRQIHLICCLPLCPSEIILYLLQLCPTENCNYSYIQESQTHYSMGLHGYLRTSYINPLSRGTSLLWKFLKLLCFFTKFIWLLKNLIFLWYCHKRAESGFVHAVTFSTTEQIAMYQLSCGNSAVCTTSLQ